MTAGTLLAIIDLTERNRNIPHLSKFRISTAVLYFSLLVTKLMCIGLEWRLRESKRIYLIFRNSSHNAEHSECSVFEVSLKFSDGDISGVFIVQK